MSDTTNELIQLIRDALHDHPDLTDFRRTIEKLEQDSRTLATRMDQLERLLTSDKAFRADFERKTAEALRELGDEIRENRRHTREQLQQEDEEIKAVREAIAQMLDDLKDMRHRFGIGFMTMIGVDPSNPSNPLRVTSMKEKVERLEASHDALRSEMSDRMQQIDQHLQTAMHQRDTRIDAVARWVEIEEERRRARQEFVERVFTPALVRTLNNPVVVRLLIAIATAVAGGAGIINVVSQ